VAIYRQIRSICFVVPLRRLTLYVNLTGKLAIQLIWRYIATKRSAVGMGQVNYRKSIPCPR
jgi:hypothetical protein